MYTALHYQIFKDYNSLFKKFQIYFYHIFKNATLKNIYTFYDVIYIAIKYYIKLILLNKFLNMFSVS